MTSPSALSLAAANPRSLILPSSPEAGGINILMPPVQTISGKDLPKGLKTETDQKRLDSLNPKSLLTILIVAVLDAEPELSSGLKKNIRYIRNL